MTTQYSRLHLWLPLSTKLYQTRSSMPILDLNVVEILRRISTITSFHLSNERTISSAQNFWTRYLQFLMFSTLCAKIHFIYSTYTFLNNQITSSPSSQTKILTTLLQSNLFIYLIIRYLVRYHHTLIVRRQNLQTILNFRLHFVDGLVPFAVPRDADVDHRVNIERLKEACCEIVKRRKSTPLSITFVSHRKAWTPSTAFVTPCAPSPTSASKRCLSKAIRSVLLEFNISANYLLYTQITLIAVLFVFIVNIRRSYYFIYFYWINVYLI